MRDEERDALILLRRAGYTIVPPQRTEPDPPKARTKCPTGKERYPTQAQAEDVLLKAKIARALRHNEKRRETRAYACPKCLGWHLTSKEAQQP